MTKRKAVLHTQEYAKGTWVGGFGGGYHIGKVVAFDAPTNTYTVMRLGGSRLSGISVCGVENAPIFTRKQFVVVEKSGLLCEVISYAGITPRYDVRPLHYIIDTGYPRTWGFSQLRWNAENELREATPEDLLLPAITTANWNERIHIVGDNE